MKKTLAFLLAVAMLAGLAVTAFAADAEPNYPVDSVSDDAYLWDDDENGVDLTESADMVPYGKTAYFPLIGHGSGGYKYVYEKEAAGNIKISKKWEEGSSYVDSIEVVKKKITPDSRSLGMVVSGQNYVYFLAVEIESSSSTADREIFGEVTLKQKGNKDYAEIDDLEADIAIEIGYDSASSSDTEGQIPITPATFKDGNGFDADSEFEFSFEADSDSYFVVNTNGQGKIVLGMDTDYDDDFGDEYPDADLYFFNGNYATFNRTGTLYLANENDDLYVYSISSDGDVSRVDAEYDDSEEAYVIRTRTLGRYVLSNEKLSTSSRSDKSSSSSQASSAVVRPASSTAPAITSTPTYTPPVSSRPASTPPPVVSSTVESSEPEEEIEEEEEEEEEEDFEEEDFEEEEEEEEVVDVIVDEETEEEPEKKKGLPGWTWALIIAGLAAIPIAIGVIYVIQTRPKKREFFDDYDDYDDDDE